MRKARFAGMVFLAAAALAQPQAVEKTVEITSEPSHHQVLENEYVRVFNVIVAPRATTLIHRHNYDYLFVTLGDTDVVNARVGEKPVPLHLKDGEVRFTPGRFAHAALNQSDRPFHNVTIELLQPSSNAGRCTVDCSQDPVGEGPSATRLYSSDQWTASLIDLPPSARMEKQVHATPQLFVAVSDLDLGLNGASTRMARRHGGSVAWISPGAPYTVANHGPRTAQFVLLDFTGEKQKP